MHHDPGNKSPFSASKVTPARTWHPHVYANPPKQLTSHFIIDILGVRDSSSPFQPPQVTGAMTLQPPASPLPIVSQAIVNGTGHYPNHQPQPHQHFHNSSSNSSSCSSYSPSINSAGEDLTEHKTVIEQPLNLSCPEKARGDTPSPVHLTPLRVAKPSHGPPVIHTAFTPSAAGLGLIPNPSNGPLIPKKQNLPLVAPKVQNNGTQVKGKWILFEFSELFSNTKVQSEILVYSI